MADQYILTSVCKRVAQITINRPEVTNKLNNECMGEIVSALQRYEKDDQVDVIALTSVGDYFCNGGELGDSRKKTQSEIRLFGTCFINLHTALQKCSKPVIAKVSGQVMGGGMSLLDACDLAVAADDVLFAVPEMKSGLAPMMCMVGLNRMVSRKKLMEMSLTGMSISAQEARALGMVNKICPHRDLDRVFDEYCSQFVHQNPTAVEYTKLMYRSIEGLDYTRQMERGQDLLAGLLKTPDIAEVLNAAEEHRKPYWETTE